MPNYTREDSGKTVSFLNELIDVELAVLVAEESRGRVHVGAHAEPPSGLLADGKLIASDHLDIDTEVERLADGLSTVVPRWVEEGEQAQKLPWCALTVLARLGHFLSRDA